MSVTLPFVNYQYATTGALRFDLPSAAAQKPANTEFALGLWIRAPARVFENTRVHTFLGRQGANTGGNDGSIRFTSASANAIQGFIRSGSVDRFNQTVTLGASAYDTPMLVMLIADATASHLVACPVGGTPIVATQADNQLYTVAMTTTPFINRLGSAPAHGFYGEIENYFYIHGGFPMVSGAPDTTLVEDIANGVQDLDALHTLMTGGARQCRYKLAGALDLADAWGLQSPLTTALEAAATGHVFRSSGPLRPVALQPNRTRAMMSQASFPTRGTSAGATATIGVEGGTYSGISPAAIQARLLRDDGTDLIGWQVADAAPSGGAWAPSQFAGVPLTAGFLTVEFRAVDGGGAQIGDTVFSHGLRGTSVAAFLAEGQSQKMHNWEIGTLAIPDGINLLVHRQYGTAAPAGQTMEAVLSSGCANGVGLGRGMRQAAIEINARYPGVPIHFMTVGDSGDPLDAFGPGGLYEARWANLAAHLGLIQPHYQLHYGHSAVPSADAAAYEAKMAEVVALKELAWGQAIRVIQCPTARYAGLTGTGGNYSFVHIARTGARQWVESNPTRGWWAGSFHAVQTGEPTGGGVDPHPSADDAGQGRSGATQAWAVMMCAGAVVDEPVGLLTATATGTAVDLSFGPVN